jgi:hypothetical protein
MFQAANASAGTSCLIVLHGPPCLAAINYPPASRPEVAFVDGDRLANLNAARCIERAAEYKQWCATPSIGALSLEATAYFVVDGRSVLGAQTNQNRKVYIFDGIARFTNFHN